MPFPQSVVRFSFVFSLGTLALVLAHALGPARSFGQATSSEPKKDAAKGGALSAPESSAKNPQASNGNQGEKRERDPAAQPGEDKQEAGANAGAAATAPVEEQLIKTGEGKIRFSFQGQPWLDVLQWLAKSSQMTLDWQELPEDKLNLATQNSYTIDEARDLLNMHLAARGFTLLRRGEVLALVKLEKLNPALVPRVQPEELAARDAHELVRVSFPLDWLVADEAVKEFEPMKSPFGKLTPMSATNRLEALDTVANLRQIQELLRREQSAHGEERLVVEFKLKHVKAEDVIDKLTTLVGAENNLLRPQDRARMQQFMRMRERNDNDKNRNNNNNGGKQREEQPVHLVINEAENSVLANAPPDKLAVIRQAVQALDVPSAANSQLDDTNTRMKIYRTKSMDPDAMQDMIEDLVESGKLAKHTEVQSDDNTNTLIVHATPADHLTIANLVSQIEDDGRDVHIIKLRQLTPEYALEAIQTLLKGEDSGSSRWGRRRGGSGDAFRVEVDLEHDRLLMWANDEEHEQVQALLAKLGEGGQAASVGGGGNIRILSVPDGASEQALENLKRIWPNLRTNPLRIDGLDAPPVEKSARQPTTQRSARAENPTDRTANQRENEATKTPPIRRGIGLGAPVTFAVAALGGEADDAEGGDPGKAKSATNLPETSDEARDRLEAATKHEAPSINITEGPGGQLIITSQDVEALDAVENLIQQILPEKADYEVFRLEHASPWSIQLTLEQIFGIYDDSYGRRRGLSSSTTPELKFISDIDTGTLLVQGATSEQLQKIGELIELYDKPETLEAEQQRKTEIYEVKYSQANAVAEVVKEVYRDLLSSNDKTFTRERREGEGSSRDLGYGVNYGSRIPQFKGLLSIGVEDNSNTLIISAPAFLIGDVMTLVRDVDARAADHKVRVVQVNGVGSEMLRGVLSQIPGVSTNVTSATANSTGVGRSSNRGSNNRDFRGRSRGDSSRGNFDRRNFGRRGGDRD